MTVHNAMSNIRNMALIASIAAVIFALPPEIHAQNPGGQQAAPPTPKEAGPIDLTGYWLSVISEDWRYRMVTPAKGDMESVPVNEEAVRVTNAWDPAADEASGNQCKSYGAPAILRAPGRLHITWQDDNTLRMDIDAGTQTRLFHFGTPPKSKERTWQGDSAAEWQTRSTGGRRGGRGAAAAKDGFLKVVTTNLRAGYLRKNGVPYSEDAVLTEYYDIVRLQNGDEWLVVTSVVDDPHYLQRPFMVSTQFRKQADSSGWNPTPCSATW